MPAQNSIEKNEQFTVSKAAEFLGLSPSSLRKLEQEGKIVSYRAKNSYRYFNLEDLIKLKTHLTHKKAQKTQLKLLTKPYFPTGTFKAIDNTAPQGVEKSSSPKTPGKFSMALILGFALLTLASTGVLATRSRSNSVVKSTAKLNTGSVLAEYTKARTWNVNFNAPAFFKKQVTFLENITAQKDLTVQGTITTPTLTFTETGTLNQLDAIDDTTETTLENALDLSGDITSDGLNNTTISANVIGGIQLADEIDYSGTLNISGGLTFGGETGNDGEVLTSDGSGLPIWLAQDELDAGSIQGVTAEQFLRSDETDEYTGGTLSFSEGTLLDLSAITVSSSTPQGLKLPQNTTLTNPSTGEGFIAYNTTENKLKLYNGIAWVDIVDGSFLNESSLFAGDVSGVYNDLQLGTGVVGSSEITNSSILPVDLSVTNSPVDDYVLAYDNGSFKWLSAGAGASSKWTDSGTITYLTDFDDDLAIGASDATAKFFFDYSQTALTIGSNSNEGTLLLYSEQGVADYTATLATGTLPDNATYTFTGATGNIVTSANAATELATWDQNSSNDLTTATIFAGDVTGTSGALDIAANAVTAAEIATDAVGSDELAATTVTAATYGDATTIPVITVDEDGRLTTVTSQAISADNYQYWQYALNGSPQDNISSTNVLNFAAGSDINIADTAARSLTINLDTVLDNVTTINGLTTLNGTSENTVEGTIFDNDAETITGVWQVQDNVAFNFGNDANWSILYDESADDRLEITSQGSNNAVLFNLLDTDSASTFTISNSDGGQVANLSVEGSIAGATIDTGQGPYEIRDATTTLKGLASFSDTDFTVTSGSVTIDDKFLLNNGDTATGSYDFTGAELLGASPLRFEGANNNDVYTTFAITDPTSPHTVTFPDAGGTVAFGTGSTDTLSYWTNTNTLGSVTLGSGLSLSSGTLSVADTSDSNELQHIFQTISVATQSNVVAETNTDTLTLVAGSNVSITTDATADSITINATDTNTTYTAGNGLSLPTTEFRLGGTLTLNTSIDTDAYNLAVDAIVLDEATLTLGSNGNEGILYLFSEQGGTDYTATLATGTLPDNTTYTFTGATGNILTSANAATELSTWDQNSSNDLTTSTIFAGDVTGTYGALDIAANAVTTTEISNGTITADDIAATLTFADDDLLDFSAINISDALEGIVLPQTTDCTAGIAEGQICWDSDTNALYVGNSSTVTLIGGAGAGTITAVGDISSGAAFTQTNGNDGNSLYFEGTTPDTNELQLSAVDPGADITVLLPNIAGTLASLSGTQTFDGNKTFTGSFTLTPGSTNGINITTDGDSLINIQGLSGGSGSALCIDASNNVVTCTGGVGTGGISGSGLANTLAYFNAPGTITSDADLSFDGTSLDYTAAYNTGFDITASLSGGARTASSFTITQPSDISNDFDSTTTGLLRIENQDTAHAGSTAPLIYLTGAVQGSAIYNVATTPSGNNDNTSIGLTNIITANGDVTNPNTDTGIGVSNTLTGTYTDLRGMSSSIEVINGAAYGSYVSMDTSTAATGYGYYYVTHASSDAGTQYVLYGNLTAGSATKNGLYITGETNNYLSGKLGIGDGATSPEALLELQGTEGSDATLALDADQGDDNTDTWFIKALASDNSLSFLNHTTELANLSTTGNLQIDGDLTVSGGDLLGANNASIDIGELVSGDISFLANNDTNDYLYMNTTSDLPALFWAGVQSYTNAPGIRVDSSGNLEYRDDDSDTWEDFDNLGAGTSAGGADTQVQYNNSGNFGGMVSLTYNNSTEEITATDDLNLTLAGTENLGITSDLAGTVNVISLTGTPSATTGTAYGFYLAQADSAETNGFDAGFVIDNLDTNLALADGILFSSAGGAITDAIDATDTDIVNALNFGTNTLLGTTGNIDLDNFDVVGATGNITTAGTLAVNGDSITADGTTLTINAAGTVDIQDNVTVDALTTDTGGITILAGQAIVPSGAGALTIGNSSLTDLTVTTDSTGNGEVVLPNDSIGPNELMSTDQNDEYCLSYEADGGGVLEWRSCAGSSYTFSDGVSETAGVVKLGGANIDESVTLTVATGGILNIDLTSSTAGQNFIIKDGGTAFATFDNTGFFELDNIRLDTNAIAVQNTDGNLTLNANGTGDVFFNGSTYNISDTGDLTLGGRITFENSEYIQNEVDGTLSLNSPTVTTSAALTVGTDLTVSGGDLLGANNASIDIGELVSGDISFLANNDTNDYLYMNTTSDLPALFWAGVQSYTNAPGIRVDSSGNLEYRDDDSDTWEDFDNLGAGTSAGGADTQVQYNNSGNFGGMVSLTYNNSTEEITATDDLNLTLAGTENLGITSDLAGTVNVISLTGTPSATTGTAYGFYLAQADSAETNGFDAGFVIDNLDTNLALADGILFSSAAGTIEDAIDASDSDIVNAINVGTNNITGAGYNINSTGGTLALQTTTSGDISLTAAGSSDILLASDNDSNVQLAGTLTSSNSNDLFSLALTNQTSSGTQNALKIVNTDTTNATTETLIRLTNEETNANAITDYILIESAAADTITDAIDVSDTDIFNAINVGVNYILGNGIRQFSQSSTTWVIEDTTSGNDLLTIANNVGAGNLGDVTVSNDFFVSGADITGANSESLNIGGSDATFTFKRNNTGTVVLTANDDDTTAAMTILPGGAAGLTLGGASTTALTVTTDSTGNGEVVLPNDSIGPNEILTAGQTDESCLSYEEDGGGVLEWKSCSGTTYTFSDGVSETAGVVKLGGTNIDESRTLTVATGGVLNIDLTSSTADQNFIIKDGGTAFATFDNTGFFQLDNIKLDGNTLSTTSSGLILDSADTTTLADAVTAQGTLTFSGTSTDIATTGGENLTLAPGTSGDVVISVDSNTSLEVNGTITSVNSNDLYTSTITNQTSSGTQRAMYLANADDATNATTEALLALNNLETTANLVDDYLIINAATTDTTADAIDVSDPELFNAINVGANVIAGTTADINFSNFDVVGATGNITTAGTLAVNGDSITADGTTLTINAAGTVDIQDNVTVDSLTTDTGGITILAGQAIVPSGAGALTIGDANLTSLTITTTGTGNGVVVLPNDSIGPNELMTSGQTDEYCLAYEATGTTLKWVNCISTIGGSDTQVQYNNGGALGGMSSLTFDDLSLELTATDDVTLTFAGTENLGITSDLAGTVNVISVTGTPSASAGTAYGFYLSQADSANANGLDAGLYIANLDTDLAMADGILFTTSTGGITDAIDATDAQITNALNFGANVILGTTGNIDMTNFDVGGATGNITTAGTLAVNGDSITADGATLTINAAGAVDIQDNVTVDTLQTDTTATIGTDLTVSGGDLIGTNNASIDVGELTSGNISFLTNNDSTDYLYMNTASDLPALFWEGVLSYSNDPGIRVDSSGNLEYRDGDSATWTDFDSFSNPFTDGGDHLYPTNGEYLGDDTSGGTNKIAGIYLADSAPLYFGTDNDVNFSFSGTTLSATLGTNDINFDSNTLFIDGSANSVGIGTATPSSLLNVLGTSELLRLSYDASNYVSFTVNSAGVLSLAETGVSVATFGEAQVGFDVPVAFNAAGDASFGYDLVLTNQTASKLESYGPLTIEVGESFENNNLSLTTYGTGQLMVNAAGGSRFTVSGSAVATLDRLSSDGVIISLRQDGTEEGTISVSGTTVSYNAFTGSHYAWTDATIEMGRVVRLTGDNKRLHNRSTSEILYGVEESTVENDPQVLGAYLAVQEPTKPIDNSNPHLVMAVGNGEMWIVDEGENIATGDYLITSNTQGHARKDFATLEKSYVIARAAEPVDWSTVKETINGKKHARISITFENFVISRFANGLANVQNNTTLPTANVVTSQDFEGTVAGVNTEIDQVNADIQTLSQRLAALESQPTESTQSSSSVQPAGADLFAEMVDLFEEFKTFVTYLGLSSSKDDEGVATLTVDNNLAVLGDTTLNNADVTGKFGIGFVQIDALDQSIGVLGPQCYNAETDTYHEELCESQTLYLQKTLAGNVDIFNANIVLTPEGNIVTKGTVEAKQVKTEALTLKEQALGSGTLAKTKTTVTITSTQVSEKSRIFITPTTSTLGQTVYLKDKTVGEGFEVAIDTAIAQDIKFDWFIVNED